MTVSNWRPSVRYKDPERIALEDTIVSLFFQKIPKTVIADRTNVTVGVVQNICKKYRN